MGQDLCPAGEVKAGRSLIWGCPLTDRATTDTGGASEVWRRGRIEQSAMASAGTQGPRLQQAGRRQTLDSEKDLYLQEDTIVFGG